MYIGAVCTISVGIADIISGSYVCAKDNTFEWYNGGFVALGISDILIGVLGFISKFSVCRVTTYIVFIFLTFSLQFGFCIGILT
jgi:hypothetical protein|mmetsp:Transcript_9917/g.1472  ORF Transcript_9917/g.1472 Transcript_9917/m.1472 type:complete len:84 (+) Transcript_9917:60-311(+)